MLISFEGIDGCGKSTQINLLKNYFDTNGIDYSVFREPGGTEISERIRTLLLHEIEEMHPVTELLLFSAARSQLIQEKVRPLLKDDKIVILDRFYDSTTAYQGYGRKSVDLKSIRVLNDLATHHTVPDITFYLKISPEEAEKRTDGTLKDRMENSGSQFFSDVSAGYDTLAKEEDRIYSLDATRAPAEIHSQISSIIENYL
ncbi:MAG: dTMP kinase [Balneolaceae bacterium]|nr:dTMP kinase [Balneolaceae bacterium]